jgi:TonB family protein
MKTQKRLTTVACCAAVLAGALMAFAQPTTPVQESEKPTAPAPEQSTPPAAGTIPSGENPQPGQLLRRVNPEYPKEAKKKHLQGDVRIRMVIDQKGRVVKTHVVSGNHILAKAATEAVRKWRFQAAVVNGKPAQVETEIEFHFHRHKWRVD